MSSPNPDEQEPYHGKAIDKLSGIPGLAILDQFMRAKSPLSLEKSSFKVDVLHVLRSKVKPTSCCTHEGFRVALKEAHPDLIGIFVLVDGITPEVVETLGSDLDLCHEFFALHLRGTQCFREGKFRRPKYLELEVLPSYFRKAPFYCLEICRPYPFRGGLREVEKVRESKTNTARGCYELKSLKDVSMRERVSVYETETPDHKPVGIILSDRLLKREIPETGVDTLTAFSHNYPEGTREGLDRGVQVSCGEEVRLWLEGLDLEGREDVFKTLEEPLAIRPLLHITAVMNSWFLAQARLQLTRISRSQHDGQFPSNADFGLNELAQLLHTCLYFHLKHLKSVIRVVKAKRGRQDGNHDELLDDIYDLRDDMEALLERVQHDVNYLASKQISLLTKVGVVFVPLSIAAAVLAIPGPWYRLVIWAAFAGFSIAIIGFSMFVGSGKRLGLESLRLVGLGGCRQNEEAAMGEA
ncbi:hypothetical protein FGG08_004141 [Glutinoglossum americanum]|uniref:Uncharacterized protein n=1 Tax=Glutinoglossum americanum TaxID=1670608 RepID=A0A9P8I6A2_9PEZI|nr:hypothetical protein FGG08_004141 [Glutinoglossum americanum]